MEKELHGFEEGSKGKMHVDLLRATLKNNIENAKPW